MESKYYIPNIDEFFVGFEYESKTGINWLKLVYEGSQVLKSNSYFDDSGCEYEAVEDDLKDSLYRVKYLDKSDIESLGFSMRTTSYGVYYIKDEYKIDYSWDKKLIISQQNKLIKSDVFENEGNILFIGIVKNKSELIKLLKQLNIVDEEEKKS